MSFITIEKKKQFTKIYKNSLKIIIDDNQEIELLTGCSQTIELSDGIHNLKFLYSFKDNSSTFLMRFAEKLLVDCSYEETIDLAKDIKYTVSIDNTYNLKIIRDDKKIETKKEMWGITPQAKQLLKKSFIALSLIFLSSIVSVYTKEFFWFSLFLYSFILFGVPYIISCSSLFKQKTSESNDFNQSEIITLENKYNLIALVSFLIFSGLSIGISLLSSVVGSIFIAVSSIGLLIIVIWTSISNYKTPIKKMVCGVLIIALILCCVGFLPRNTSHSCGHPACEENGPFPCYGKNNTCKNSTNCYKDLYCDECD